MHLNETGIGKLAVSFLRKIKSFKRFFYFNFCPHSTAYSLGKQRIENPDKALSKQEKYSSAYDLFLEKGFDKLNVTRSQNPNRILITHINYNSLRNKFEILKETITIKVDILLISKTKLDSSFSLNQFDGFITPYRLDRNQTSGVVVMLYVKEDIASWSLTEIKLDSDIEIFL